MVPAPTGCIYATAYRIEVDDTPYISSPEWIYDTENTRATPMPDNDFVPLIGQDYFWRVCPLRAIEGNCMTNPNTGLIWWSQIWKARFDNNLALPATAGVIPELLRPT